MKQYFTLQVYCSIFLFIHSSFAQSEKIKGITFRGPDSAPFHVSMFQNMEKSNADWVAFIPAFIIDRETLHILPETRKYHWYESRVAAIEGITTAQQLGYKIVLKPHLKLLPTPEDKVTKVEGSWRGTFSPIEKEDWKIWENAYEKWMLGWATVADSLGVEMLCMGTELKVAVVKRPHFWRQLISKIRAVYSGKLIYSANWDEYKQVKFWEDLDYIGVNAYFPLHDTRIPTTQKAIKSWRKYKKQLRQINKKVELPIIFTEFGYRNVEFAAKIPWEHEKVPATLNDRAQENLYEAFFRSFAKEKWVVGYFLWQWQGVEPSARNTLFTPQGKPALKVLQKWYQE